ncbi:MAG: helix-turn-helix domain-containing protein [Actinomycetota bacterium]
MTIRTLKRHENSTDINFYHLHYHLQHHLAAAIGTSRSNLSNHLACLRGCGLIRAERVGRHQQYELISAQLADALRSLLVVAATLPRCDEHDAAALRLVGS